MPTINNFLILDSIDEFIYLSNLDYSLVFINKKLREVMGIKDHSYVGEKCFKFLQGNDIRCSFCISHTSEGEKACQRRYLSKMNAYYNTESQIVKIGNKKLRLTIVKDITSQQQQNLELERSKAVEDLIVTFVTEITKQRGGINEGIEFLLKRVVEYYKADSGYVFEYDPYTETASGIFEALGPNVESKKRILQNMPLERFDEWNKHFIEEGRIFVNKDNIDQFDFAKFLNKLKIYKMIAYPFWKDGKVIGFIRIDNPKHDNKDFTLLESISFFIFHNLIRRHDEKKFVELSYTDALTKIHNRNAYYVVCDELEANLPKNVGVIYMDLNGLKKVNDLQGHKKGDECLITTAEVISRHFPNKCYRIGGDEFAVLVSDMDEKIFLKKTKELKKELDSRDKTNLALGYIFRTNPASIGVLLSEADRLMYLAKELYYSKLRGEEQ